MYCGYVKTVHEYCFCFPLLSPDACWQKWVRRCKMVDTGGSTKHSGEQRSWVILVSSETVTCPPAYTWVGICRMIFQSDVQYYGLQLRIIHPSKKVMQHDFDRLYLFYPEFVFIKLDIPGKPVYLPFDWCLICSDCFTEACAGWVNWGQWQKGRVAKLIGFYGKCVLCLVSCFPFVSVCTRTRCARAHALYRNPPKQNTMLNFK